MINRLKGIQQLWLQVNDHAWFHLYGLRWPVRNGEGAKNLKWKYMSLAGFEPTPRCSTNQCFRSLLVHDALMMISVLMSYRIIEYKLIKLLHDNTCQIDYGYMCIWNECQTKLTFLISMKILASIITVSRTLHWVLKHNRFHTGIVTCPFVFIY